MLGLAAIASSIARPPEDDETPPTTATTPTPSASPTPGGSVATIRLGPKPRAQPQKLRQGRPATLFVSVTDPGQVEIPDLGLVQSAEPLTPARFDLLVSSPATYPVVLRRPSGGRSTLGKIEVVAAKRPGP